MQGRGDRNRGSCGFLFLLLRPCIRKVIRRVQPHAPTLQSLLLFVGYWRKVTVGREAVHFQTCAVMCAEFGAVDPPVC